MSMGDVSMEIKNPRCVQQLFVAHGRVPVEGSVVRVPYNIELVHFTNPGTILEFDTSYAITRQLRHISLDKDLENGASTRYLIDPNLTNGLTGVYTPGPIERDVELKVYKPHEIVENLQLSMTDPNPILQRMIGFYFPEHSQLNMYDLIPERNIRALGLVLPDPLPRLTGKYLELTFSFKNSLGNPLAPPPTDLGTLLHFVSEAYKDAECIVRLFLICCREGAPIGKDVLMVSHIAEPRGGANFRDGPQFKSRRRRLGRKKNGKRKPRKSRKSRKLF